MHFYIHHAICDLASTLHLRSQAGYGLETRPRTVAFASSHPGLSTNGANSVPPVHPSIRKSNALYVASEHVTPSAWETPLAKVTLLVCWASAATPHEGVMAERAAAVALVHPVLLASAHAAYTLVVTPPRALWHALGSEAKVMGAASTYSCYWFSVYQRHTRKDSPMQLESQKQR
jgi:hypothetical protein